MNIVVVAPMLREFHCAREAFGAAEEQGKPFRYARLSRKWGDLRIINCGPDPRAALEFEVAESGIPGLLIDSGTAGGLSEKVRVGDLYRGARFLYDRRADIMAEEDPFPGSPFKAAAVLTVDRPVVSSDERAGMQDLADICTMESYHLASMAKDLGCSFLSFRVVTDLADEYTAVSFKKNSRAFCLNLYDNLKASLKNISH
jgi:hypothetical protein